MNPDLAEDLLRTVMGEAADVDFPDQLGTLRSLAAYKYDSYEQYAPGRQFIESLAHWLEQFPGVTERKAALAFVQERLIYVSDLEMRHLIGLMARDRVPTLIQRLLALQLGLPNYRVKEIRNDNQYSRARRSTLFLGMSDGARLDQFRRNCPELSNEQFSIAYEVSQGRAERLVQDLRRDLNDPTASFQYVFLLDDFAGSGSTILRAGGETGVQGRIARFAEDTLPHITGQACPQVFVGLYLATAQALGHLATMLTNYPSPPWPAGKCPEVFAVATLEESIQLRHDEAIPLSEVDQQFDDLLHGNYDCSVEDEHKGKVLHGYADCGLPLILSHNTPNNSLYLLWEGTRTRPLFPRFERHQGRLGGA